MSYTPLALLLMPLLLVAPVAKADTSTAPVAPVTTKAETPAAGKATVLIQAAAHPVNGDVVRVEDDSALSGEYVTHPKDYNPLFMQKLAPVSGDTIIVWARLRGITVQLKGIKDDGQHDFDWNYDAPKDWKWVRIGKHSRSDLGDAILLIRGPNAEKNGGLDAVILTSDDSLDPNTLKSNDLTKYGAE